MRYYIIYTLTIIASNATRLATNSKKNTKGGPNQVNFLDIQDYCTDTHDKTVGSVNAASQPGTTTRWERAEKVEKHAEW